MTKVLTQSPARHHSSEILIIYAMYSIKKIIKILIWKLWNVFFLLVLYQIHIPVKFINSMKLLLKAIWIIFKNTKIVYPCNNSIVYTAFCTVPAKHREKPTKLCSRTKETKRKETKQRNTFSLIYWSFRVQMANLDDKVN